MNDPIITPELIALAGIDIPDEQIETFLEYANEQLDERVGETITELLDDDQLAALVHLQESSTDEAVGAWIRTNVANLDQIIQDEVDILLGEIAEQKDAINSPA